MKYTGMIYRRLCTGLLLTSVAMTMWSRSVVLDNNVKTLQVVVNQEWLSPPVMQLGTSDVLNIGFDELSHTFHRYIYRLEHCEADWTTSEGIFESDWLEGFNDNPIDYQENSLNTTVLYTHYQLQIPNDRCRLKMSGNYRLHVYDEDNDNSEVLCAEFYVVEPLMNVRLGATTNTDIDLSVSHQQVSMAVDYGSVNVTNDDEQLWTVVMQNAREDNRRVNPRPTNRRMGGLAWEHSRELIFDAGNEYRKYEVLDVSHPTMGIEHIVWDAPFYHAYPYVSEPRRNYLYDEDANGAFYIRNSDNIENDRTCDYVYVHYKLRPARNYAGENVFIDGKWTTEDASLYVMEYDEADHSYNAVILQKQGYYSYQYLMAGNDGKTHVVPEEGSYYETENTYQALVYYKGTTDRTWRLTGYQQISLH